MNLKNFLSLSVFTLIVTAGSFANAQEIPVSVSPGVPQVLPGPNNITYKIQCVESQPGDNQPIEIARIGCAIVYSGGPAHGVMGNISEDKCMALETAVLRCRAQMNSRDPNVLRFCNPSGNGFWGMGAKCDDQHGNSVDVTDCDAYRRFR